MGVAARRNSRSKEAKTIAALRRQLAAATEWRRDAYQALRALDNGANGLDSEAAAIEEARVHLAVALGETYDERSRRYTPLGLV